MQILYWKQISKLIFLFHISDWHFLQQIKPDHSSFYHSIQEDIFFVISLVSMVNGRVPHCDSHRWKKIFTFWEGGWTLKKFCQKNSVFSWVHRKFWIYKTRYSDHFDICRWKVVIFLDLNNLQSKYWIYTYFPTTFCHF